MLRLDKMLSEMGVGSRSELKKWIRWGRVTVDGKAIRKPEYKVDPESQVICLNGTIVTYQQKVYYMMNKPQGVVSATSDKKEKTVLDLIEGTKRKDLFPVGRLDKDTEGLLLITNDGDLSHKLLSPSKHVDKTYFARIDGIVTEDDVVRFQEGLDIGDEKPALPAKLQILKSDAVSEILITIQEGRYHQVKRMFEAVDKTVIYLKRLSMGSLQLDDSLKPGEYRTLTEEEYLSLC